MFACERFGIEPDVLLIAKGVTSGYAPLGAMLVGPRVAEPFFRGPDAEVFRHGITYSGHATACAVAHANLDVLEREGLMGRVADLEPVLQDAVGRLAGHELVDEVRGAGLLAGVQLRADVDGEAVVRQALDEGVVLRIITGNTIQICPPFVATPDEVRSIPAAIERALARVAVAA
jgi:adenosylmethionine-8-amino-7-oxononanoate aminotransferase